MAGVAAERALDRLNLLVASSQTGFGAFVAVYLTSQAWTQAEIGQALSIGTITAMASQIPAGALVDAMRSKRLAIGMGGAFIAVAALLLALFNARLPIYGAEVLHGFASCMIGPAIAAVSLDLARGSDLGRRLGRNAQFSSIGSGIAAGVLGGLGAYWSEQAVFWMTAGLMLVGLTSLGALPDGRGMAAKENGFSPKAVLLEVHALLDLRLLVFAACLAGFNLGNAAMLPTVAGEITRSAGRHANLVIAASIIVPQLAVAALSRRAGVLADHWGRRRLLLAGFAALPLRGFLLSLTTDPVIVVAVQALDGISGAVLGVLVPLVAADLAAARGAFNLCMGLFGLAIGAGATISTLLAGIAADHYGPSVTLALLAVAGLVATIGVLVLPETRPSS